MTDLDDGITLAMRDVDVFGLMRSHTSADLVAQRASLVNYVWAERGLPTYRMPDQVFTGVAVPDGLPNVWRADRIVIGLGYDLSSTVDVYWTLGATRSGSLVVYHGGHQGPDEATHPQTLGYLARFLQDGHTVIRVSMPCYGSNYREPGPLFIPGVGTVQTEGHNDLWRWGNAPSTLRPLGLYLEGTCVALNYTLGGAADWNLVAMTGYSGGGWSTLVYAACDPRIRRSYAVAGSLPVHFRVGGDFGDWENVDNGLMAVANYLELYLLASSGPHRRHVQINNHHDPACFAGGRHKLYVDDVRDRLSRLGAGSYDFWCDEWDQHSISPRALSYIARDLLTGRSWPGAVA